MRTIRIKLYKFDELSKDAQKKAIENLRDINTDHEWFNLTTEDQNGILSGLGYKDPKILFSGFSSQGDGACFTCDNIDFTLFMAGKYAEYTDYLSCSITHSWRYYFATSTTVNLDLDLDNDDLYNSIETDIKDERERLGNEIYRLLESEYEYLCSDTAIIETIQANEYEFTKDGNLNRIN